MQRYSLGLREKSQLRKKIYRLLNPLFSSCGNAGKLCYVVLQLPPNCSGVVSLIRLVTLILLWLFCPLEAYASVVIERLPEPPAVLTSAFLSDALAHKDLQPSAGETLRQPVGKRSVWRVTLGGSPALAAGHAVLVLGQTMDREVTLYMPPSFAPQRLNLQDPNYRSSNARDALVVDIPPALGAGAQLWLEFENPRSVPVSVAVRDSATQAKINTNNVRFYTAMMVLMLACCGVAACFYLVLREWIWLLYIVKVLGYWIYMGGRTGEFGSIADAGGWPALVPWLGIPLANAAALFAAGVSAFFYVRFVEIEKYAPRLRQPLLFVGTLMMLLAPIALMATSNSVAALVRFANLCIATNTALVLYVSFWAIRGGSRPALYYLIADFPIVLTLIFQIGSGLGWVSFPELSNRMFLAAHAFSGIVISFGLAHQVLGYRQQRDEAISTSERDPLTGALNRRAATNALSSALSTLEKGRGSVCVCFLDLDFFKKVNDKFGHHFGDEALKFLVREAEAEMRGSDLLARMGGEEFILVLPGAHLKDGIVIAERIRVRVQSNGALIQGREVNLTVSIGVSASTSRLKTPEELIDAADQALYRAKDRGRNRVEAMNVVELQQQLGVKV